MIAICVDDEPILLDWLVKIVSASPDVERAEKFTNEEAALAYAAEHAFDLAFLDVELHSMNGLTVAERLRTINPDCGIVFCTGHENYAIDAISRLRVDGYLLKPIDRVDVQREIDRFKARYRKSAPLLTIDLRGGVNVFDRDGKPVSFKRGKTEQLLAVLALENGQSLSVHDLCERLWDDSVKSQYLYKKNENYLTHLFTDLRHTLTECNALDVLKKTADGYALRMSFVCVRAEEK